MEDNEELGGLLRRLRDEVRARSALVQSAPELGDGVEAGSALGALGRVRLVDPMEPIPWPSHGTSWKAWVKVFVQRATRRFLRWYINGIVDRQNEVNDLSFAAVLELTTKLDRLSRSVDLLHASVARLERRTREQHGAGDGPHGRSLTREKMPTRSVGADGGPSAELDYFQFEARHRGSIADIRRRQERYVPYFRGLGSVLDIGCGRGEFVSLLREQGIDANGVDLDLDAVLAAKDQGLPICQGDAIDYLSNLADGSLGGVFLAQVAEHLTIDELVRLLRLTEAKLVDGGVCIVETINPTCLHAYQQWFLRDPTHRTPLHPETLRFLVESQGFCSIETLWLSPVPDSERLGAVHAVDSNLATSSAFRVVDQNFSRLNAVLFGPQDFAIVGRKAPEHR